MMPYIVFILQVLACILFHCDEIEGTALLEEEEIGYSVIYNSNNRNTFLRGSDNINTTTVTKALKNKNVITTFNSSSTTATISERNRTLIVGGQEVPNEQQHVYPWFALISIPPHRNPSGSGSWGRCGGSLITPNVVLTAAHCGDDLTDSIIDVGAYDTSTTTTTTTTMADEEEEELKSTSSSARRRTCIKHAKHPDFHSVKDNQASNVPIVNDFALCLLNEPVYIDGDDPSSSSSATTLLKLNDNVGFGQSIREKNNQNNNDKKEQQVVLQNADVLREASMQITSNEACVDLANQAKAFQEQNQGYNVPYNVGSEEIICTMNDNGNYFELNNDGSNRNDEARDTFHYDNNDMINQGQACGGDSGGPLFVRVFSPYDQNSNYGSSKTTTTTKYTDYHIGVISYGQLCEINDDDDDTALSTDSSDANGSSSNSISDDMEDDRKKSTSYKPGVYARTSYALKTFIKPMICDEENRAFGFYDSEIYFCKTTDIPSSHASNKASLYSSYDTTNSSSFRDHSRIGGSLRYPLLYGDADLGY